MNALIDWFGTVGGPEVGPVREIGFNTWLYTLSSFAIGLAFLALACAEFYIIAKRKDLSFKIFFWLFIILMGSFGVAFLCDSLLLWLPVYPFISFVKLLSAFIAWGVFVAFVRAMPSMLYMTSHTQLKETIEEREYKLKVTNQKLTESERQFRILVNHHPDYISQLDKNLKYVFVNKTILQNAEAGEDFFVGKTIYELGFPESFVSEQEAHLQKAFENGTYSSFETLLKLPHRGPRRFRMSIIPVRNKENERVESVLNIAKDITDQREFEDELNETIHELQELSANLANKNRQLQDFAYIVSHNLRSPMSNLVSLMSLYEKEESSDEKDFLVKKIGEVTRSFSKTIDDLTEVVKIRQEINMEFQQNHFESVFHHIKTLLERQIVTSGATIQCDFSACTSVRYPKVYLESIVLNLVTNALKYRSDKRIPLIKLSTKVVDGSVLFTCEDNGLGIDLKKYGDKIFGMNKTFHPNPDSRGMGLFITKNQLESLGGAISVESEPDKGSVFTVMFS